MRHSAPVASGNVGQCRAKENPGLSDRVKASGIAGQAGRARMGGPVTLSR